MHNDLEDTVKNIDEIGSYGFGLKMPNMDYVSEVLARITVHKTILSDFFEEFQKNREYYSNKLLDFGFEFGYIKHCSQSESDFQALSHDAPIFLI